MTPADESSAEATTEVRLRIAVPEDAPLVLDVIHRAFGARPAVDPPADALGDTVEDVVARMETGETILAEVDGHPAASLVVSDPVPGIGMGREQDRVAGIHRVSVLPGFRQVGLASRIIRAAILMAVDLDATHIELLSRREFPQNRHLWESHGFQADREVELGWIMRRELPVRELAASREEMQALGSRIARVLRPGDLVIASGGLGAGKTTLTQGLAEGLDVEGNVISPTFVISRIHRSRSGGPDLVHVDAYRLGSAVEVEDLDLAASAPNAITLVEWGVGMAEGLSDSALRIDIQRSPDPEDETRTVLVWGEGQRWVHDSLREALADAGSHHNHRGRA